MTMDPRQQMLLEIGVENPVPVSDGLYIVDGDEADVETFVALFNRKPLGITGEECGDLLWELYEQNYIAFYNYRRYPFRRISSALELDRDALIKALRIKFEVKRAVHPNRLFYHLTSRGGAVWETLSHADWNRFLDLEEAHLSADPQARPHVRLRSAVRAVGEEWYALDTQTLQIGVPKSRRVRLLKTWHPTYWKSLPQGFQIDYDLFSEVETSSEFNRRRVSEPRRINPRWYDSPKY